MRWWRRLRGDDDGSIATLTVLSVVAVLAAVGPALVAVTDLGAAASRARAAADAAALAGAGTSFLVAGGGAALAGGWPVGADADAGEDAATPDRAARAVAAANGADFVRSDVRGWPLRYGVTVEVIPRTAWVRRIVGPLRAEAVAAVRPRVPIPGS